MIGVPGLACSIFVGGIIKAMLILHAVFGRMGARRRGG